MKNIKSRFNKNKKLLELNQTKILKLNKIKNKDGSINLSDFKEILVEQSKSNNNEFLFICNITKENNIFKVEFKGKNFSKNVIQNRWHRGILLKYKKAIKLASKNGFIEAKSNGTFPNIPLNKVSIEIEVHNPISRDDDANYDTLKWMRDTFTVNKLIIDDNRQVIINTIEQEVISKDWKIIFFIKDLNI